jgi:hypothetical protein
MPASVLLGRPCRILSTRTGNEVHRFLKGIDGEMSLKQKQQPSADHENQVHQQIQQNIHEQVIERLGIPSGLHTIHVRQLWPDRFRVNVYVGTGAVGAKIAHSYFLTTDGEGNILAATPNITKKY